MGLGKKEVGGGNGLEGEKGGRGKLDQVGKKLIK